MSKHLEQREAMVTLTQVEDFVLLKATRGEGMGVRCLQHQAQQQQG